MTWSILDVKSIETYELLENEPNFTLETWGQSQNWCSYALNADFILNRGKLYGVIYIHSALSAIVDSIKVKNNNVLFGKMFEVKEVINIAVIKSYFENNYCTSIPCALSIEQSDNTDIESCTFLSAMLNDSGESVHSAVDIRGKHVNMKKVHFYRFEGVVVTGESIQSMSVHNISYSCPENYYFHTYIFDKHFT